jgi:hypothetical protein
MRFLLVLLALSALAAATESCLTPGCGAVTVIPPDIKVTDAVTGQSICDATVIALANTDNADAGVPFQSYVPVWAAATDCRWQGPIGGGTVTLVVSKPGYKTAMAQATWYTWGCGSSGPEPQPQEIDVRLTPG